MCGFDTDITHCKNDLHVFINLIMEREEVNWAQMLSIHKQDITLNE